MAKVWQPCPACKGQGGWSVQDARGKWVNVECQTCFGSGGKYVNA